MRNKNVIYKSLYSPILFVGCEKLPFMMLTTIGAVVILFYQRLWISSLTFIIYLLFVVAIRRVNSHDKQFFTVLYRYIFYYQDIYLANANYPGIDGSSFLVNR